MRRGIQVATFGAAVIGLAGCPADAELAELRLFPCLVDGVEPASLRVEVQPRDEAGGNVGEPRTGVYSVEQSVFGDGFATLGYRPVAGTATIEVQVWWYASTEAGAVDEADATSVYAGLPAPSAGQIVDLGSENCDGVAGTDGSTTVEPTETSTTGSSSSTTDGSTSTTMGVTNSSTTTDGTSTTDGTTTMVDPTTGDDTTGTTGGEMSMEGTSCSNRGELFCEPRSGGGGRLLLCDQGIWEIDHVNSCGAVCAGALPEQPNPIGCAGEAGDWVCLCQADTPPACTPADEMCASNLLLNLCVDNEEAVARCPSMNCAYTAPQDFECSI